MDFLFSNGLHVGLHRECMLASHCMVLMGLEEDLSSPHAHTEQAPTCHATIQQRASSPQILMYYRSH